MAYDSNTRLLLKFEGSTPSDTSEFAHAITYAGDYSLVPAYDPFGGQALGLGQGTGSAGAAVVTSPGSVLSAGDSIATPRRVDLWMRASAADWGYVFLIEGDTFALSLTFSGGSIYLDVVDTEAIFIPDPDGDYYTSETIYLSSAMPTSYTGWQHIRIYIDGYDVKLGLNGSEVSAGSLTYNPVIKSSATYYTIGAGHPYYGNFAGFVDSVSILEDDTSWSGGSYTVPSAPPDDFGPTANNGQGSNTVAAVESAGAGSVGSAPFVAVGANTLDSFSGAGLGEVTQTPNLGAGANTLDAITSRTQEWHNEKTKLLLKFDQAPVYSGTYGAYCTQDTSVNGRLAVIELVPGTEIVSTPGVFGSPSLRVGNPLGSYSQGRLYLAGSAGLFSDSQTSAKRFDLWYRREAAPVIGLNALFSITFANSDYVYFYRKDTHLGCVIKKNGTVIANTEFSYSNGTNNVWRHVRLLLSGNSVTIASAGLQRGTLDAGQSVWPGSVTNPITNVYIGDYPDGIGYTNQYGFRGCFDAIEFLEGDTQYTGGSYSVPAFQPSDYDPLAPNYVGGVGSNTLANVTQASSGIILVERFGAGSNAINDFLSAGQASLITAGSGQSLVEDISGYGEGHEGQWWVATGANVVDSTSTVWEIFQLPVRLGSGTSQIDTLSWSGAGLVQWLVKASGANEVSVSNLGEGLQGLVTGSGANTVNAIGSGSGSVLCVGSGEALVSVAGSGGGVVQHAVVGLNTVTVSVVSEGRVETLGRGEGLVSVVSYGASARHLFGYGDGAVSVASLGYGATLVLGIGAASIDDIFSPRSPRDYESDEVFIAPMLSAINIKTHGNSARVMT